MHPTTHSMKCAWPNNGGHLRIHILICISKDWVILPRRHSYYIILWLALTIRHLPSLIHCLYSIQINQKVTMKHVLEMWIPTKRYINIIISMLYLWTTCYSQGWSICSSDYWVGWSTWLYSLDSLHKSYERVEMDMRELVLYKLIQAIRHVAARVNGIYTDDMI